MADLEKAMRYVAQHGDVTERARLMTLLGGSPAPEPVIDELAESQQADGGWVATWSAGASSLDATCNRLARLEALGAGGGEPVVARGLAFLAQRQRTDGSWQEAAELAETAPARVKPGMLPATLDVSANCAFWLSHWEPGEATETAAAFLASHQTESGRLPSFMQAQWVALGVWLRAGEPYTAAAGRLAAYLSDELERMQAHELAWLLTVLLLAGAPDYDPLVERATVLLAALQEPDGRWPGEHEGRDVHTTLEALRVLLVFSRDDEEFDQDDLP